jgi:predicted transcriptional regulator
MKKCVVALALAALVVCLFAETAEAGIFGRRRRSSGVDMYSSLNASLTAKLDKDLKEKLAETEEKLATSSEELVKSSVEAEAKKLNEQVQAEAIAGIDRRGSEKAG